MPVSPGGAAPVTSVFGRTGAVTLQTSDVTPVLAGATVPGAMTLTGEARVNAAPAATTQRGLVNLGAGPFDGTAGSFAGSSSGTHLAINAASGFVGNLIDLQVGGPNSGRKFVVTSAGAIEVLGTNNSWLLRSWDNGYQGSGTTQIIGVGDESRHIVLHGLFGIHLKTSTNTYAANINQGASIFQFTSAMKLSWGAGNAAAGSPDTNLYRGAANVLQTDDQFKVAHLGSASPDDNQYGLLANPSAAVLANYRPFGYKRQSDGAYPFYVDVNGNVCIGGPTTAAEGLHLLGKRVYIQGTTHASLTLAPDDFTSMFSIRTDQTGQHLALQRARGRVFLNAASSAPTDSDLWNGSFTAYLDQTSHNFVIRVRYSDGTLKTATIPLT